MKPGDIWLDHFRGSRYQFGWKGIRYTLPEKIGFINAIDDNTDLIEQCKNIKGAEGGRLYITENRDALIIKRGTHNGRIQWFPYYVTTLHKGLGFEDIDNDPSHMKPGQLWTGFLNHHGGKFILRTYGGYRIAWRIRRSEAFCSTQGANQDLIGALRAILPQGGTFYVNENRRIWTSVPRGSQHFPNLVQEYKQLGSPNDYLIHKWFEFTQRLPVYVGKLVSPIKVIRDQEPCSIVYEEEF